MDEIWVIWVFCILSFSGSGVEKLWYCVRDGCCLVWGYVGGFIFGELLSNYSFL